MLDPKRLLAHLFHDDAPARKGRFRARADARRALGDDPYAAVRAIAAAAAESLGPIRPELAAAQPSGAASGSGAGADPERARALLFLRAMIAAAQADGAVDADERARILARLRAAGADAGLQRLVEAELSRPVDLYAITSEVRDAATAAEVYVASLAAIRVDTEAERRYLDRLAVRLGLDHATVARLEERLAAPAAGA